MSTVNLRNFSIANITSLSLVAVPGSVRAPLPDVGAPDVMVVNNGSVTVFVRAGNSDVVADALAMPVLPGEKGVYSTGPTQPPVTHISAFVLAGAQAVTVIQGSGM